MCLKIPLLSQRQVDPWGYRATILAKSESQVNEKLCLRKRVMSPRVTFGTYTHTHFIKSLQVGPPCNCGLCHLYLRNSRGRVHQDSLMGLGFLLTQQESNGSSCPEPGIVPYLPRQLLLHAPLLMFCFRWQLNTQHYKDLTSVTLRVKSFCHLYLVFCLLPFSARFSRGWTRVHINTPWGP